jgi:PAS domain S-box-containing protein
MPAKEFANRSRDFYLTFLDKFPALIWRSDTNAKCDYFNQAWLDFTGRRLEQEMGDGWTEGVHPKDLPACLKSFLEAFHTRQPFACEFRLRRHDGEYRWILDQGRAFNDLDGQFAGYMGSCFDITDAKRTEHTLRESEKKFRLLADNITDVFWMTSPDITGVFWMTSPDLKTIHYISPGYELIWGRSPESLHANPHQWVEAILPEQRARVFALFRTLTTDAPTVSVEYQIARPDGTIRWVHDRGFQVRDAAGNVIRLAGVASDVTERKEAEEAKQESEARFHWLVDSNMQGMIFSNIKGEIIQANDAFLHIVGYSRADMEAGCLNRATFSPPEYAAADRHAMEEMTSTGVFTPYEKEYLRRDGTTVPVLIGGIAFEDDPKEGVCFVIDLTKRKEAEKSLKDSHAQLRALSARLQSVREEEATRIAREIHDELGQKLTGLKMDLLWTEKKLGELTGSAAVNALLDRVVGATELVDEIAIAVLEIATKLRPGVLDKLGLGSALQYEARRFQERNGLACEVCVPATEPKLSLELATTFFRIFQECLTNVIRHANASKVEVELKVEDGWVTMCVRDDGRGITEAELASPKSLGLVGMKERAALLGGEIVFQGGSHCGTIMTVRIPNSATPPSNKELV